MYSVPAAAAARIFAVGIKPKQGPLKTLQGGGAFAKERQTIKDNSVKRRGMSFVDNTNIQRLLINP